MSQCLPETVWHRVVADGLMDLLVGDQDPEKTVRDVVECVSVYLNSAKGYMPRNTRPEALRGAILGRVPPIMTTDS